MNFQTRSFGVRQCAARILHVPANGRFFGTYGDNDVIEALCQQDAQISFDQRNTQHWNECLVQRSSRSAHALRAPACHNHCLAANRYAHNSQCLEPFAVDSRNPAPRGVCAARLRRLRFWRSAPLP